MHQDLGDSLQEEQGEHHLEDSGADIPQSNIYHSHWIPIQEMEWETGKRGKTLEKVISKEQQREKHEEKALQERHTGWNENILHEKKRLSEVN